MPRRARDDGCGFGMSHLSGVRRHVPLDQIAFGNNALVPFRHVFDAVARLFLIVGYGHDAADLVISFNAIMRVARDEMDCLADGELVRQDCLLQIRDKTFRDRKTGGAGPPRQRRRGMAALVRQSRRRRNEQTVDGMNNAVRRLDFGTRHLHFIDCRARGSIERQLRALNRLSLEHIAGHVL